MNEELARRIEKKVKEKVPTFMGTVMVEPFGEGGTRACALVNIGKGKTKSVASTKTAHQFAGVREHAVCMAGPLIHQLREKEKSGE